MGQDRTLICEETDQEVMPLLHDMLVDQFGQLASPLCRDSTLQVLDLPGGEFRMAIQLSEVSTITLYEYVGAVDFSTPGLADCLLREHSDWVVGRLDRCGDFLCVSHSFDVRQLEEHALLRTVLFVHQAVLTIQRLLTQVGVDYRMDAPLLPGIDWQPRDS